MRKQFVLLALSALLTQYVYAQGEPNPPRSDVKSSKHHQQQNHNQSNQQSDDQSSEGSSKLQHK